MRVFVTGASGHIGSALVPELLAAGHEVTGLARSLAAASALEAQGVLPWRGDLDDLASLGRAARAADGVIHLAFKHELAFSGDFPGALRAERAAIEALGAALEGSGKPLLTTSGTMTFASSVSGREGTEADDGLGPRVVSEHSALAFVARGVRAIAIRLPPTVHSDLDHRGFIPTLVAGARANGYAAYVGSGLNRWPAAHTRDVARLYRLALEVAPAGTRLHAVADRGVPFREIAGAIARGLGVEALSVPAAEAGKHLGFLAGFAGADNPTSSERTRELTGWTPTHTGLLEDLAERHYFDRDLGL
jgi:nucleoside-diphosphate-sugar epimerase